MDINKEKLKLSKGHKLGLIVVGVFEIVFGLCSVGCAITTIVFRKSYLANCYRYFYYSYNDPYLDPWYLRSNCNYSQWLLVFTTTAQGLWTGIMIVISASLSLRFAAKPTKQTGSISTGFSVFSFVLTMIMVILESFAVATHFYGYYITHQYFVIWGLHCGLLALACSMFVLSMTSMIISYIATGCYGCCCYKQQKASVAPMDLQYNAEYGVSYQPQTITAQIPHVTERRPVGPQAYAMKTTQPAVHFTRQPTFAYGGPIGQSMPQQSTYPQLAVTPNKSHPQEHASQHSTFADGAVQSVPEQSVHPQPDTSGQQPE